MSIEGTDVSYFGFCVTPASENSNLNGPLYGWVKLDGSASVADPLASENSEVVSVNWAYDHSGQPVIAGSTESHP